MKKKSFKNMIVIIRSVNYSLPFKRNFIISCDSIKVISLVHPGSRSPC